MEYCIETAKLSALHVDTCEHEEMFSVSGLWIRYVFICSSTVLLLGWRWDISDVLIYWQVVADSSVQLLFVHS